MAIRIEIMSEKFEQISLKPGFMKHNGGVMFRNISDTEYEFKSAINENHSLKYFMFKLDNLIKQS